MITIQTVLKITDNSGALQAMCINLPVDNTPAKIGETITVVVKKSIIKRGVKKSKEIKKGQVTTGLIVRTKIGVRRWGGIFVRPSSNALTLINKYNLPIATRIYGPVLRELRVNLKYLKVISIAQLSL